MNRVALALASGVATFIAVYAVASAMGLATHNLATGGEAVTTCDGNGFTIDGVAQAHINTPYGSITLYNAGDGKFFTL